MGDRRAPNPQPTNQRKPEPPPAPPARADLAGPKPFDAYLAQMSPNERRAVQRGLASLDAMALIWGARIKLTEVAELLAGLPPDVRAERIAAMMRQAYTEGAYQHYLDTTPERKPGEYSDNELLRRVVSAATPRRTKLSAPRWVAVMDCFGCGSTVATELCKRFGLNPDEILNSNV